MTETVAEILHFEDLEIRIIRSARRRMLSVEIDSDGIKARAPQTMRENTIRKFVRENQNWVRRQLGSITPRPQQLVIEHGVELSLLGQSYELRIQNNSRAKPRIKQGITYLPLSRSHLPIEQTARSKLIRWYKYQALLALRLRVRHYVPIVFNQPRKHPPAVKVREYKRRWGSCDHRGELSFNWRIIMAPASVVDYVVVHELAHLIEFNHSCRFWQIVEQQLPGWKIEQQWLADHGGELYRI